MEGTPNNRCAHGWISLAAIVLGSAMLGPTRAQTCDAGNPCEQADVASQAAVTPGTGANNPIDIVSGNKYQREVDYELPGELALSFVRHYNSSSVQGGAIGGGWSHGFETAIVRHERTLADNTLATTLTIVQADGRRIHFQPSGQPLSGIQRYASLPFGYGVIEEDVATIASLRLARAAAVQSTSVALTAWRWRWMDGRELSFDASGTLKEVRSSSGSLLSLKHDKHRRLVRIVDSANRELQLSYYDHPSEWLASFTSRGTDLAELRGQKHRLKRIRLPDASEIMYLYDANGLLGQVIYGDRTTKRYQYTETSGALRLSRIIDRDGHTVGTYAYDGQGRAIYSARGENTSAIRIERLEGASPSEVGRALVTNLGGSHAKYSWRTSPHGSPLLTEGQGDGCEFCPATNVRYSYTEHGLLKGIENIATKEREVLTRDALGRITDRHRHKGHSSVLIERYEYADADVLSKPSRIVRPSVAAGRQHIFDVEYNHRDQPTRLSEHGFAPSENGRDFDSISRSTTYTYFEQVDGAPNLIGKLKSIDGPLPGTLDKIIYSYDPNAALKQISYSTGHRELFDYDSLGRLRQYTPLDGVRITLEYDSSNRLSSYTRAGLRTTISYDGAGRMASLRDPIGQQFTFGYDDASRLISITDSGGNRIELDADAQGRPLARRLRNPDGSISQEILYGAGDLEMDPSAPRSFSNSLLAVIRLPSLKTWTTSADALIPAALMHGQERGHVHEIADARGLASQYSFDDFGRLVRSFNPDQGLVTLRYDAADRLSTRTFADGRSIHYRYDALGRPISITALENSVAIEYDSHNKPSRISYPAGEERFEYDTAGRVVRRERRIDGHRFETAYRYDALGRLIDTSLLGGQTLLYRYNTGVHAKPGVLNAIEQEQLFGSRPIITGLNEREDRYDLQTSEFGNGLRFERQLDRSGHLRRFGTAGIAMFDFDNDAEGRITGTRGWSNRSFMYDGSGRLIRSVDLTHHENEEELVLDSADNIRIAGRGGQYVLMRVDQASNRILARSNPDGSEDTYLYDAAGRTTHIGKRRLEYDAFGRLGKVLDEDRLVAEYAYNAFGQRIRKVSYSGSQRTVTYFFYDGSKLTAEANEKGHITRQYVYVADRIVAMLVGDRTYAMHTDWRGTPVAATDEHQRIAWRADADVLGRLNGERGAIKVPLRGSNQYFDEETGLHYNTHRYFDPSTARYLSPDPLGQAGGLNLYAFAGGDPVNSVDPFGLQAIPADWDTLDRVGFLLKQTLREFPSAAYDELVAALEDLISPAGLATTAGIFAAWAASQLTPFGWAADLAIVGVGFLFMGKAVFDLAMGTVSAYRATTGASTMQELCAAAKDFAKALAAAAIELGGGAGIAGAARAGSKHVAAQMRRMFGRGARAPPPGPLQFTMEMLERVTDSFGNRIRQFMAGRDHMWTTPAERARWRALEDAAESFARKYFNAQYVFNARHNNGAPNPNGNNGFDVAFLDGSGQLVIGEAKSGDAITALTAFGAGTRGREQLELNLRILRSNVELDTSIPLSVKESVLEQIDNFSFETHLYISPTSSIPNGRLDIFPEMLGKPLDAIYILPEAPPARD